MFSWLPARCPVSVPERAWLDDRAQRLTDAFGTQQLMELPTILPNEAPWRFDQPRLVFDSLARIFDMDTTEDVVEFSPHPIPIGPAEMRDVHPHSFVDDDGHRHFLVTTNTEPTAMQLSAACARCLAVEYLLDRNLALEDDVDLLHLGDLLTVALGLGIFTANTVIVEWNSPMHWTAEDSNRPWSVERSGQLTMPMFGYALAWFHLHRDNRVPNWRRHLRLDVRQPFTRALRYLQQVDWA